MAGLLAFLAIASPAPAHASVGLLVSPARIDLALKPSDATLERDLTVVNAGSGTNRLHVAVVDVLVNHGAAEILPLGSTPYSAVRIATLSQSTLSLDAGRQAVVRVRFDVSGHRPFLTGLLVTADVGSGTQIPQVLVTVSAAPVDATGELLQSVQIGLAPVRLSLPALDESGPIDATATLRNNGNTYERVFSTYEFSTFGHTWLRVQAEPSSAMPGATASTSAGTVQRLEASGQAVDTAPWACICEVRVSTVAWLADRQTTPPVVQSQWIVIFPWRVALLVLIGLGLLIASRWLWRRRSH